MTEQLHWVKDDQQRRYFHAWLKEAQTQRGLNLSYDTIKAEGLGIASLYDWQGDLGQCQAAILQFLDYKAGKPLAQDDGVDEIPF